MPLAAEVLRAILDGDDAEGKVIAIDAIGALDDSKARLSRLAADPDVRVRARVATAIAQWKPHDARTLLAALSTTPTPACAARRSPAWRSTAISARSREVTQALEDPSLGVRLAALGALVRLGRDSIGNQLLALNSGHDRYVALRAAVQLSRTSGAQAALPACARPPTIPTPPCASPR